MSHPEYEQIRGGKQVIWRKKNGTIALGPGTHLSRAGFEHKLDSFDTLLVFFLHGRNRQKFVWTRTIPGA